MRFIGTLLCAIFGVFMLPILIFAHILLAMGMWCEAMYMLWREM